jgi:hypothetical protein
MAIIPHVPSHFHPFRRHLRVCPYHLREPTIFVGMQKTRRKTHSPPGAFWFRAGSYFFTPVGAKRLRHSAPVLRE